jgi:hypothetical protein
VKKPGVIVVAASLFASVTGPAAYADGPGPATPAPPDPLTTVVCRDRERPEVSATLVFNIARRRLVQSSGVGTILFGDNSIPAKVTPATIEWEAGGNTFWLNRATLELDVNGRVFFCQLARNQL